jgi:hypothetical protein
MGWRAFGVPAARTPTVGYGPLPDPDANGVRLPEGLGARKADRPIGQSTDGQQTGGEPQSRLGGAVRRS